MQSSDAMSGDAASQERAQRKIDQALELLREAREELQPWAPPSAVNDLQAAESVLQSVSAKLPER